MAIKAGALTREDIRAMKRRTRTKKTAGQVVAHIVLILSSLIFLLPFIWMVSTSLKIDQQIFLFPPKWIPNPIKWVNYKEAVEFIPFFTYLKNTIIIAATSTVGVLISCSLGAYSFSRIRWPGRDILFIIILSTMMLPFQVTMIPLFIVFRKMGWVGTFKPLTVPFFFGNAFFIFLLRQFFMTIPYELSDAAKIDGCSEFGIYWRIMLPLVKPALFTIALFRFLDAWMDFIGPLLYLTDESKYTISLGLQQFQTGHTTEWSLLMAASTIITIPIIIIFFFTQRTFIQGIALTGLKG